MHVAVLCVLCVLSFSVAGSWLVGAGGHQGMGGSCPLSTGSAVAPSSLAPRCVTLDFFDFLYILFGVILVNLAACLPASFTC